MGGGAQIEMDCTNWNALRGKFNELSRVYNFKNLGGPGTTTSVDLRCRLTAVWASISASSVVSAMNNVAHQEREIVPGLRRLAILANRGYIPPLWWNRARCRKRPLRSRRKPRPLGSIFSVPNSIPITTQRKQMPSRAENLSKVGDIFLRYALALGTFLQGGGA
jgi:hypothetical protein